MKLLEDTAKEETLSARENAIDAWLKYVAKKLEPWLTNQYEFWGCERQRQVYAPGITAGSVRRAGP